MLKKNKNELVIVEGNGVKETSLYRDGNNVILKSEKSTNVKVSNLEKTKKEEKKINGDVQSLIISNDNQIKKNPATKSENKSTEATTTAKKPATQPAVPVTPVGSIQTVNGSKYLVTSDSTVAYSGTLSKTVKAVSIPSTVVINGNIYTVTEIYPKAFAGCKNLKAVSIPATIQKIGAGAFYKCKKLKKVYVKTSLLTKATVGAAAFKKIYKKAKFYVPSANKKYYKKLFRKRGAPKKIKVKGF